MIMRSMVREVTVAMRRLTYELSAAGLPRSGLEEVCLSGGGEAGLGDTPTLQWSAYKLLCHQPLHYTYLCLERGLEGFGRFVKNPFLYSLPFLKFCFFFP